MVTKTKIIIDLTRSTVSWQLLPLSEGSGSYYRSLFLNNRQSILYIIFHNEEPTMSFNFNNRVVKKIFFFEGKSLNVHQYHLDLTVDKNNYINEIFNEH